MGRVGIRARDDGNTVPRWHGRDNNPGEGGADTPRGGFRERGCGRMLFGPQGRGTGDVAARGCPPPGAVEMESGRERHGRGRVWASDMSLMPVLALRRVDGHFR